MLYACTAKFDVMENLKKFTKFLRTKQDLNKGTANTVTFINDGAFYIGVAYIITIYELALVAPHCKIQ